MKKKLEIGCGSNRREMDGYENFTLDLIAGEHVDFVCNVGFEPLRFKDNTFDLVQAFDVLEHIPKCIWSQENKSSYPNPDLYKNNPVDMEKLKITKMKHVRHLPLIDCMNEIYRVLKHDGRFIMETPFSNEAYYRDPTHITRLSRDWFHYFTKDDNLYFDQGLVQCNFKLSSNQFREYLWTPNDIMHTELYAVKNKENNREVFI